MTASIEISGLERHYNKVAALAGIDLTIDAGQYCVLLGPSGCGKTTLLNIIGGFADPSAGTLLIGGKNMVGIPAARRPTTTVFQDYALFPHMNLVENVAFGLRMRGVAKAARIERARAMLELVGLKDADRKKPGELSGGQRQRVALARALAVEPDVLLLDEPLGALDLNLRRAMQEELKSIQRKVGATFVHVTHDQEEAMAIADLLVVMNAGQIEDLGDPERVYRYPATRFAASFLGEMNFLAAEGHEGAALTSFGPAGTTEHSGPITLCIRPEHLLVGGDGLKLPPAKVNETIFQGRHRRVRVSIGSLSLLAALPVGIDVEPGAEINLAVDTGNITILQGGA